MSEKVILQLGAGALSIHSIKGLKEMGVKVHAVDRNANAPGFKYSDGFAPIDIVDAEAVFQYAKSIKADAILAVNEFGVMTAAKVAQRMGLEGLLPEVALRCLDKGLMRDCWAENGLPQPQYVVINSLEEITQATSKNGFPLILKPTMNCGSRGVSVVRDESDLAWAIDFANENGRDGRFILEEFISGTEMTIEGLVCGGKPQVLAMSDKEAQDHPKYRVAMALNYPAKFEPALLTEVEKIVCKAALALGIKNGAFHCECMVNERGVFLVEMGGRPGGGHIFGQIVEAASGINMPQALAKILLHETVNITPLFRKGACYKFFTPPPGIFKEVIGLEQAVKMPGIIDLGFEMSPGTVVGPISGDASRPGFVVSGGETREEAIANANQAIHSLKFVVTSN